MAESLASDVAIARLIQTLADSAEDGEADAEPEAPALESAEPTPSDTQSDL